MAHNSTTFAQLLKLVLRHEFEGLAEGHGVCRLMRRSQFLVMRTARPAGRTSLRDVLSNLSVQSRKLRHLRVGGVSWSSLGRAQAEKPWGYSRHCGCRRRASSRRTGRTWISTGSTR